ncbi:hypothetical protein EMCG_05718 [[Emmonsia] crescens]|uniref:Protein kinase domain-containing protein n=1 Tax=[Emmonsia] crescens TaxID=73230 RepID=A0A0G2IDP4_9EURO|nr:hypothetical protein EMCG_05718 [Emmonsia crescens UAMH 3008]
MSHETADPEYRSKQIHDMNNQHIQHPDTLRPDNLPCRHGERHRTSSTPQRPPQPQNKSSSGRSLASLRIVRVSGPGLQEQPKRFKMIPPRGQEVKFNSAVNTNEEPGSGDREIYSKSDPSLKAQSPARCAPSPPKLAVLDLATAAGGKQASIKSRGRRNYFLVNGVPYTRLDFVGRGGSCRVYQVITEHNVIFALKRVDLKNIDEATVRGFRSEIDLLKKLTKVDRVVDLRDWELDSGKQLLTLVMEFGHLDFETTLKRQINSMNAQFDMTFTRHYWKEMLECVAAVHAHNIVHSDLKPANFVLIKGRLKIIDFGIANLIDDNTVNVYRDHQVGTPNYMAPEALLDNNSGQKNCTERLIKIGKPSDIWSLGCILYQMTYGKAPFAHIPNHLHRAMAIINPNHTIDYPVLGIGGVRLPASLVQTMKTCLSWEQRLRPTTDTLLSASNKFLYPDSHQRLGHISAEADMSQEQLGAILRNVVGFCRQNGVPTNDEVAEWSKIFLEKLKLAD